MTTEAELREKLRKIYALFEGATTPGERDAAEAAINRVKTALAAEQKREHTVEMRFSLPIDGRGGCSRRYAAGTGWNPIVTGGSATPA